MSFLRKPTVWISVFFASFAFFEIGLRAFGTIDFPLYDANAQIGYIPSANQHGSFLNKNDWESNSLHMGAPEFVPGSRLNVLLIGDSVVYGGNPYRRADRLGPVLQFLLQDQEKRVWPISAGSWALRNELAWLRQNPQVVRRVEKIAFVLNSADFGDASSWSCELTHPRSKPILAIWYVFNKYVYAVEKCGQVPPELRVPDSDLEMELRSFLTEHGQKTLFFIYPDKAETSDQALLSSRFHFGLALLKKAGAQRIFKVADDKRWEIQWYRDEIHPTPKGNRVLAQIIYDGLSKQ